MDLYTACAGAVVTAPNPCLSTKAFAAYLSASQDAVNQMAAQGVRVSGNAVGARGVNPGTTRIMLTGPRWGMTAKLLDEFPDDPQPSIT